MFARPPSCLLCMFACLPALYCTWLRHSATGALSVATAIAIQLQLPAGAGAASSNDAAKAAVAVAAEEAEVAETEHLLKEIKVQEAAEAQAGLYGLSDDSESDDL